MLFINIFDYIIVQALYIPIFYKLMYNVEINNF